MLGLSHRDAVLSMERFAPTFTQSSIKYAMDSQSWTKGGSAILTVKVLLHLEK